MELKGFEKMSFYVSSSINTHANTISRKVKPMIQDSSQIDKYRQNIFRRPAAQNNFTGNTTDDINRYISNR